MISESRDIDWAEELRRWAHGVGCEIPLYIEERETLGDGTDLRGCDWDEAFVDRSIGR